MAYKAFITNYVQPPGAGIGTAIEFDVTFINTSTNLVVENYSDSLTFGTDLNNYTLSEIQSAIQTKILAEASIQSYSMNSSDIIFSISNLLTPSEVATLKASRSFNYTPARSIVTGTGATGFQVSSTRDSVVTYTTKIVTTATIAGGQEGYVVLEIAPTNSATAGDWKEVGRVTNGQALSLALTLQSIQPVSGILMGLVPAGYYVKIRSVNTTGTPTYTMLSGQEVLI